MNLSAKFAVSPSVVSRTVGEETVILDLESGTYFGLEPVGARMWVLIEEGKTLAEMCSIMMEEYAVSRETLEQDALRLASELVEKNLVSHA